MLKRFPYYRILLGLIIAPALIWQSFIPVLSSRWLESQVELVYSLLLPDQSLAPSSVAVVEIDGEAETRYGWPLPRPILGKLVRQLSWGGHPPLLSFLHFQAVDSQDQSLVDAIAGHGRYVGSGLAIGGDEWQWEDHEDLVRRALIVGSPAEATEDLPLSLAEGRDFVEAQRDFGMSPRYGTEPVIYCVPLYTHSTGSDAAVAIPSSVLWALSLVKQADISTSLGLRTSRYPARPPIKVSRRSCLSHPGISTRDYLRRADIPIYAVSELLEDGIPSELRQRQLVILASHKMKRYQGPGDASGELNANIVPEHLLTARFVDNFLAGSILSREPLNHQGIMGLLPLLVAAIAALLASIAPVSQLILAFAASLMLTLVASYYQLVVEKTVLVPIPLLYYLASVSVLLVCFRSYLVYYGVRVLSDARHELHRTWNEVGDFQSLESSFRAYLESHCRLDSLDMSSVHPELFAKPPQDLTPRETGAPLSRSVAEAAQMKLQPSAGLRQVLSMAATWPDYGSLSLQLTVPRWQRSVAQDFVQVSLWELQKQWLRIDAEALHRAQELQLISQKSREEILHQFLTASLVQKVSSGHDLKANLQSLLTPRPIQACMMQADIRAYSKLFTTMDPLAIATLVKSYYENTVHRAQKLGQVKVIGDCLFIFIEDHGGQSVRQMLGLAQHLIQDTIHNNKESGYDPIKFGIAIHIGEVVVGNLSSDSCIDYTVVGQAVNQTARMEELTKNPEIKAVIGRNGVLLSEEAARLLPGLPHQDLPIAAMGLQVRSFPDVERLSFMTAEDLAGLGKESSSKKAKGERRSYS